MEAHWDHEELAHRFVVDQPNPRVQIHLGLELSANVLADLRRWTLRQPELQLALLEAPTIRMSISCEFSQRRHFMRIQWAVVARNEKMDLSTEPHWLRRRGNTWRVRSPLRTPCWWLSKPPPPSEWSRKIPELCGSPSKLSPLRLVQTGSSWKLGEQPLRALEHSQQSIFRLHCICLGLRWCAGREITCVEPNEVQVWGHLKAAPEFEFELNQSGLSHFQPHDFRALCHWCAAEKFIRSMPRVW